MAQIIAPFEPVCDGCATISKFEAKIIWAADFSSCDQVLQFFVCCVCTDLFAAIQKAFGQCHKKFGKIGCTIGQVFRRMKTQLCPRFCKTVTMIGGSDRVVLRIGNVLSKDGNVVETYRVPSIVKQDVPQIPWMTLQKSKPM